MYRSKNILSNAKRHLGKKYLLNIDLDNFFHQIDMKRLIVFFMKPDIFRSMLKQGCIIKNCESEGEASYG
jgi:hypothetical protein